jgi:ERCC4-type nuclease
MQIICDDRERRVIEKFRTIPAKKLKGVSIAVSRVKTGDFTIVSASGKILASIERKTWSDLAASIRDGRKKNIEKQLQLRRKTGCTVYILIEGTSTPNKRKYGGVQAKSLIAFLDRVQQRRSACVIYARNCEASAERMLTLAINIASIQDESEGESEDEKFPEEEEPSNEFEEALQQIKEIREKKKRKNKLSEADPETLKLLNEPELEVNINELLLRTIRGVGEVSASKLLQENLTLQKLCRNPEDLESSSLKLAQKKKIATALKSLPKNTKLQEKILNVLPGVGPSTAKSISDQIDVVQLMVGEVEEEELASVVCGKRRFGNARAKKILQCIANDDS